MSAVADAITAATAVIAACIAAAGLRTWRQQLVGQAEYDIARRVLRAVLDLRDQIATVRNPFMSAGEMFADSSGTQASSVSMAESERQAAGVRAAYDRRWSSVAKARSELRAALVEAEVLWGQELAAVEKELNAVVSDLFATLAEYLDTYGQHPSETGRTVEDSRRMRATLYARLGTPKDDAFAQRVTEVVRRFEDYLRPHLRARGLRGRSS